jgi:hypothetical protein
MTKNTRFKNNSLATKAIYSMFKKRFLFLLCIACAFVLLTPLASLAHQAATQGGSGGILPPILPQANFNIAQITQSLAALALVSAFLERGIEIVFRIKISWSSDPTDQEPKTDQERKNKQKQTQITSFIGGLIISAIGVRGLEPLFIAPNNILQLSFFRAIDILLTGIIISEGTAGVHNILTSLTAFLAATEEESKQKIVPPAGDGSNQATPIVPPAGDGSNQATPIVPPTGDGSNPVTTTVAPAD